MSAQVIPIGRRLDRLGLIAATRAYLDVAITDYTPKEADVRSALAKIEECIGAVGRLFDAATSLSKRVTLFETARGLEEKRRELVRLLREMRPLAIVIPFPKPKRKRAKKVAAAKGAK